MASMKRIITEKPHKFAGVQISGADKTGEIEPILRKQEDSKALNSTGHLGSIRHCINDDLGATASMFFYV